jgi:hypothetical protein
MIAAHLVSLSLLRASFLEQLRVSGGLWWCGVHLLRRRCRVDGHGLLDSRRVEALSGVMVTATAGTTKIVLFFYPGDCSEVRWRWRLL